MYPKLFEILLRVSLLLFRPEKTRLKWVVTKFFIVFVKIFLINYNLHHIINFLKIMIKKINILINREGIVFYTIYPLILNKRKLLDLGYKITFYFKLSKKLLDCDILIFISKPTQKIIDEKNISTKNNNALLEYLSEIRSKVKKIIWFDNSDSSSVTI